MRIKSLLIKNFRGVDTVGIDNCGDAIVIAGSNGCGKSSIFDAIRLLKSAYGQYHENEYQSWFNEFQVNVNELRKESDRIIRDKSKPMVVAMEFGLEDSEKQFIYDNAKQIYLDMKWSQIRQKKLIGEELVVINPAVKRANSPIVEAQTEELLKTLLPSLEADRHTASVSMMYGHDPVSTDSPVAEFVFSVYSPGDIGIVDYHGPNRSYARERLQNISLSIRSQYSSSEKQNALYNTEGKYRNVKSQMANEFIRQVLSDKYHGVAEGRDPLKTTLDELFSIFFPGKKFLGPVPTPDGGLAFPIELEDGTRHDINELSSGEKEVLLGYLRLRNSSPSNSIILMDEPELHLNPRLIRGLPGFYQKHIVQELNSQLWMITHSDTLLREAVDEPNFSVFHMRSAHDAGTSNNQVDIVQATAEVERVLIELVGDLATYSPRSKIVFVEGEGSRFDENMIRELFPEFSSGVNLISLGDKDRVVRAQGLMDMVSRGGYLDVKFYSIVDRDFDVKIYNLSESRFAWGVYHIENYLLNANYISKTLATISLGEEVPETEEIDSMLKECAKESLNRLVAIRLKGYVDSRIQGAVNIDFDPSGNAAEGANSAIERSSNRFKNILLSDLSRDSVIRTESIIRKELEESLENDDWKTNFRGRDILKCFVGKNQKITKIRYEGFRNVLVGIMKAEGYRPEGMASVLDRIQRD